MKRLTKLFAETTHGTKGYESINKIKVDTESIFNLSEIIVTLGKLEDVLEKYGIKNLDEYISALMEARKLAIEEGKTNFKRYMEETIKREKLETELDKLKQNTPNCSECKHLNKKIELNIKKKLMSENNQLEQELAELKQKMIVPQFKPNDDAYIIWNGTVIDVKIISIVTINEYFVKTCNSDLQHDGKACIDENDIFATQEEAEQALKKIGGKDE